MINSTVRESMLEKVAMDLLSIQPLLFREIRSKLIKTTLADADLQISPLGYEVMSLLEDTGTIHIAKIGEDLYIARAQLTHMIDRLVGMNMVERKTGKADRRTANISLTNRGRAFLDTRRERLMSIVTEIMSGLTDEELEDLSNTLNKLKGIFSKFQYLETQTLQGVI